MRWPAALREMSAMHRLWVGTAVMAGCSATWALSGDLDKHRLPLVLLMGAWWVLAVVLTRWQLGPPRTSRMASSSAVRTIVLAALVALIVQLPGLLSGPRTSSDAYRYVWDGRVQLSGTSPYRYAPLDDRLADLRDPLLFPGLSPQERSGFRTTPLPSARSEVLARAKNDPRTLLNRPQVPTIYPPVAQAWFTAVAVLTPWSWGTRGLQLGSALLAAGVAGALAWLLRRGGRDPREVLWWSWCPLVVAEVGNGAHVDILAAALIVAALAAACRHRAVTRATRVTRLASVGFAGLSIGLATAVKLYPAVLLAGLFSLRRRFGALVGAGLVAVATVALGYLPHWLAVGPLVAGYLPGYLLEEGGSNRNGLLAMVLPSGALTPAAVLLMAAIAATIAWQLPDRGAMPDGGALASAAATLLGSLLLVTTPSYPWYAIPLVACAVLAGRLEWLAVAAAAVVAYAAVSFPPLPAIGYAVALVVVLTATWRRWRRSGWLSWRECVRGGRVRPPGAQ